MTQTTVSASSTTSSTPRATVRRLLRTKEAAEYIGVSPWKLRKLVKAGKLPFIEDGDGSPWRIDIHDLDAYSERDKQRL